MATGGEERGPGPVGRAAWGRVSSPCSWPVMSLDVSPLGCSCLEGIRAGASCRGGSSLSAHGSRWLAWDLPLMHGEGWGPCRSVIRERERKQ